MISFLSSIFLILTRQAVLELLDLPSPNHSINHFSRVFLLLSFHREIFKREPQGNATAVCRTRFKRDTRNTCTRRVERELVAISDQLKHKREGKILAEKGESANRRTGEFDITTSILTIAQFRFNDR